MPKPKTTTTRRVLAIDAETYDLLRESQVAYIRQTGQMIALNAFVATVVRAGVETMRTSAKGKAKVQP